MFDGIDAGFDGDGDGFRGGGMHGHLNLRAVRFAHNGLHFVHSQTRRLIAHYNLDQVGAFVQRLADRAAGVVGSGDNAKLLVRDLARYRRMERQRLSAGRS